MNLLAIDPGTYHTGLAVFNDETLRATMTISAKGPPLERSLFIMNGIKEAARRFKITDLAIEEPVSRYANTAPLRTLFLEIIQWANAAKLPFRRFLPGQVKRGITGSWRASKEAIAVAISQEYDLHGVDSDQVDAIAIGLHYLGELRIERLAAAKRS